MASKKCLAGGFTSIASACRQVRPRTNRMPHFGQLCATPRNPALISSSRPNLFLASFARSFSSTPATLHGHIHKPKPGEELWVTFIDKDGDSHKIAVSEGDNLLDIAQAYDLEMEGACGGSCACSTCHVVVEDDDFFDRMPEPDDDENDMLDLAFGLTETSRLGCQVNMTKDLDGLVIRLPSMTRNLQASDFTPKAAASG